MDSAHKHWIWAGVAIVTICLLAWIYSSNRADQETYKSGSFKNEDNDHKWGIIIEIGKGSCATLPSMKGVKDDKPSKTSNHSVNAVKSK